MNQPNLPQQNASQLPDQVPEYLRALQVPGRRRMVDQLAENLGAGSVPYISIANGRFTLKSPQGERQVGQWDQTAGVYLDCMIIDQLEHRSRIFYVEPYNPGQTDFKPPQCFSHNGSGPSTQSSEPQAPTCAACPKSEWGSAVSAMTGKGVPACSEYQLLAIELPGDPQIWLLRVPPASLKNLKTFNATFANFPDRDICQVLTRIWFEPGKVGSLQFAAVGWAPAEMVQYRNQVWAERKTDVILSRNDRARDPASTPMRAPAVSAPMSPAQTAAHPGWTAQGQPGELRGQPGQPGHPGSDPAPSAGFPQTSMAPQQAPPGPPAQAASPSEPPKRGRKRNTAQAPQATQQAQPQPGTQQAPFRPQQPSSQAYQGHPPNTVGQPQPPQGQPQGVSPAAQNGPAPGYTPGPAPGFQQPQQGQQFGIAQPIAPDPAVQAALNQTIPR